MGLYLAGEGNGNPLQCSCLETPMDRGAWQPIVPGVTKSQTPLKECSSHAHIKFMHLKIRAPSRLSNFPAILLGQKT